ncbi:alpha/beta hydrolase [Rhizobium daejeonense]|uniref:Alpha/beta hydrolase n=1 Tax=Rhizobium daejeonense TaxID=240521 RepID=A0A6M1RW44_9HYPH|nr:alpha/beta fold hydrolase [Rhizobium daejeonense]NGO65702.1 alpha/beta hydrolase [Rhizobium daejeonense]
MAVSEYIIPGMFIRDHLISVPLDWAKPDGEAIEVFAREVCDPVRRHEKLPLLAFLQGGPGGKSPRPANGGPSWLAEAIKTHRVVLLDQRGTGRSSRVESATMERFGSDGQAAGDYLAYFRADSIVADFEHVRKTVFGGERWATLGQSYGGFLTLTYLSRAPEGLSACYVTGGLAGLDATADDVYRLTYPRVAGKTKRYYERYPEDRERIGRIADFLAANDVRLPDGDRLSVRRFQTIGIDFGMAPGFENIHWMVDEAFSSSGADRLSDVFLASVMSATSYDANPLFAVLQESIYGQGHGATNWAAERIRAEFPQFGEAQRPLTFTGEMMFSWMFDEIRSLRPFRAGALALAAREEYSSLYDPARLASNEVPVAAAVYFDDMYVDAGLSLDTASRVGNLESWVTNEFEHDGVRQSPRVFRRLVDMVTERGGRRS